MTWVKYETKWLSDPQCNQPDLPLWFIIFPQLTYFSLLFATDPICVDFFFVIWAKATPDWLLLVLFAYPVTLDYPKSIIQCQNLVV